MTDPYVRPDVRALLDAMAAAPGPKLHQMAIADARASSMAMRSLLDVPMGELAVRKDLSCPGPEGLTIRLRLYDAKADRAAGPALVFFHGGGFVVGDLDSHEPICAEIARLLDLPVIAVDYRLAPENPWPAAPHDAEAAARWVASSPEALGRQVTGLVLAGDSAGGTLTIVTAMALRDDPAAVPVVAQWPIYPVADLGMRTGSYDQFAQGYFLTAEAMAWFTDAYQADQSHWRASPMVMSQAGMPRTLVITAGLDPLRDQGRAYAAACIEAGVETVYREAAGIIHGFCNMRRALPSAQADIEGCIAILKLMIAEALPEGAA